MPNPASTFPAAADRQDCASGRGSRGECLLVSGLLAAVFILNLATSLAYPKVWQDEVMYSDPSANWASGKGFTSSAWYVQTSDKFWAANAPLHEIILGGWIRVFGFSPLAVRSINYVWFVLGTFLVWRFCVRARWIENTPLRLLLVFLLACGSAVSFSYRSGRPDMIGYFFCTAALAATTIQSNFKRYLVLFCLGIFFPWAGMQLLPLLLIATGLALAFWGWRGAMNGVCTGLGAGVGLLGLYWFYQSHGVWQDFVESVRLHATGPEAQIYAHGQIAALPDVFTRDRSAPFLLLLCLLLAWHAWRSSNWPASKIILSGVAAGVCIPAGLHFIGVFPIYYGWMAALPVALALCQTLSLQPVKALWMKCLIFLLLACAMGIGLPARLAVAALRANEPPYSAAEKFISGHLKASDEAYIDYSAFYPAMLSAKKTFTLRYFQNAMTADEKNSVNVLVIRPQDADGMTNALPGGWKLEGEYNGAAASSLLPPFLARHLSSPTTSAVYAPYQFVVYRRNVENPPQK